MVTVSGARECVLPLHQVRQSTPAEKRGHRHCRAFIWRCTKLTVCYCCSICPECSQTSVMDGSFDRLLLLLLLSLLSLHLLGGLVLLSTHLLAVFVLMLLVYGLDSKWCNFSVVGWLPLTTLSVCSFPSFRYPLSPLRLDTWQPVQLARSLSWYC